MRTMTLTMLLSLVLGGAACGGSDASIEDMEKMKTEACACKEKACADKLEKKVKSVFTDSAIQKRGEKGMDLAFGTIMCLELAKEPIGAP
jgi:hypothetical protein